MNFPASNIVHRPHPQAKNRRPTSPGCRKLRLASAIALAPAIVLLCGCQVLTYDSGTTKLRRIAVGTQTQIHSLQIAFSTNGLQSLSLDGYAQDQTKGLEKAAEGVVRGLNPVSLP